MFRAYALVILYLGSLFLRFIGLVCRPYDGYKVPRMCQWYYHLIRWINEYLIGSVYIHLYISLLKNIFKKHWKNWYKNLWISEWLYYLCSRNQGMIGWTNGLVEFVFEFGFQYFRLQSSSLEWCWGEGFLKKLHNFPLGNLE